MDKFGRVSLKISNTGFWSCSSLKHERSNRKSVNKWSIFTSWTALIAPICRSIAAQVIQIQFTLTHILWYTALREKELKKNLKCCNTFDFKVHEVRFLCLNLRLLGFRHRFGCFNSFLGSTPCHFGVEIANSTNDGGKITNYTVPISKESTSLLTQKLWSTHTDNGIEINTNMLILIIVWENDITKCNYMCWTPDNLQSEVSVLHSSKVRFMDP